MATRELATWIHELSFSALPESVVQAAIKSFYNYVGVAVGGHDHEAIQIALKSSTAFSPASGPSSLLGSKKTSDPLQAALINGFAAHIHDYDDTHLATVIHPTAPVASALVAYSEYASSQGSSISGEDFILALAAGMEVECILGLSVYPSHYDVGWHITGTVGSIGAAVAVGKAMEISVEHLQHAIGISSAASTGMREHFGSHTKAFGVGKAAQSGLQAAFMAEGGLTASEAAIDGKRGWIACVCPEQDKARQKLKDFITSMNNDKSRTWETEKNAFKPYPCGIVIHPAIDGCSQLHRKGIKAEEIKKVNLYVHPLVLELTGKKTPRDGLEGKFSVYHGAACGLLYGKATPAEYTDEAVKATAELRSKITATVEDGIRSDEARIVINDGEHELHVEHAVGSLEVPMTEVQLEEKFMDQVVPVLGPEKAAEVSKALWDINVTPYCPWKLAAWIDTLT